MTELQDVQGGCVALAYAEFVDLHQLRLQRIIEVVAARFGLRRHDRDDLFQEALTRLLAAYPEIAHPAAAFSYVEMIAIRLVIDAQRRRQARDQSWLDRVHRYHAVEPTDPADVAVQRARVSIVRRAVRGLPARERRAIELADFAELSTSDGAAAMEISPTAFKGLVQRGRRRLRRDLRDAPFVLPPLHAVCRPRASLPARYAATSFVGVAAWCAMLVYPDLSTLPHVQSLSAVPVEPIHGAPVAHPVAAATIAITTAKLISADTKSDTTTDRRNPKTLVPDSARVCVGTKCVGDARNGDELCLTDGQGRNLSCTKQSQIAICDYLPDTPYATCDRHGDPDWIVPPPLP